MKSRIGFRKPTSVFHPNPAERKERERECSIAPRRGHARGFGRGLLRRIECLCTSPLQLLAEREDPNDNAKSLLHWGSIGSSCLRPGSAERDLHWLLCD